MKPTRGNNSPACHSTLTTTLRAEAAGAGFYVTPWDGGKYPKLQILTIADLLNGERIAMPHRQAIPYRKPKAKGGKAQQSELFNQGAG